MEQNYVAFGDYLLDRQNERLLKCETLSDNEAALDEILNNTKDVKIEPQLFLLLALLIEERGQLVSRDLIQQHVWAGRHVSDEAIRAAIKKLRQLLNDDARAPRYIKTVPRQGYKLLTPVISSFPRNSAESNQNKAETSHVKLNSQSPLIDENPVETPFTSHHQANENQQSVPRTFKQTLWAACAVLIVMLLIVEWRRADNTDEESQQQPDFTVTPVTTIAGSEVFASIHPDSDTIVFSHRANAGDPQQLYLMKLAGNDMQRLSWDDAHYTDPHLSFDGRFLAVTRKNATGQQNLVMSLENHQINLLQSVANQPFYVAGWSHDNRSLYLAQEGVVGKNRGIWRLTLDTEAFSQVTAPSVAGAGDFAATESFNGDYLAVLREVAPEEYSLLVINVATGELIANRTLPMKPARIIWHQDNQHVSVSAFNQKVARFNLTTNRLQIIDNLPPYTNAIFADCTVQTSLCYLMRQHNGNYMDVEEQPMLLSAGESNESDDAVRLSPAKLLALSGAQDFPVYGKQTGAIYYASRFHDVLTVQRWYQGEEKTLACWDAASRLSALQISPDEQRLFAVLNGQLALVDASRESLSCQQQSDIQSPRFLTRSLEIINSPVWTPDSQAVVFSQARNGSTNLIQLTVKSGERETFMPSLIAWRYVDQQQAFAITEDRQLIKMTLSRDGQWLRQLRGEWPGRGAPVTNQWAVASDSVYVAGRKGRHSYVDVFTASGHERRSTGNNRFSLNFDISQHPPGADNILLVKSLGAESNLVKVSQQPQ